MIAPLFTDNIPIQVASTILIVLIMACLLAQGLLDRKSILWIIPVFLWMVHGLAFYLVLGIDRFTDQPITPFMGSYTLWSSILRFHGYLTIFGMELTHLIITFLKHRMQNGSK